MFDQRQHPPKTRRSPWRIERSGKWVGPLLRPSTCILLYIDYGAGGGGDAYILTNFSTFLNYGPFIIRCIPPQQGGPIRGLGFHRRSCLVGHGLGAGDSTNLFRRQRWWAIGGLGSGVFLVETEVDESWDLYTLPETNEMNGYSTGTCFFPSDGWDGWLGPTVVTLVKYICLIMLVYSTYSDSNHFF